MTNETYRRLSDKIVQALELAVEQKDAQIADFLGQALELSLTRNAGGKDFVERRDFSDHISSLLAEIETLKKSA